MRRISQTVFMILCRAIALLCLAVAVVRDKFELKFTCEYMDRHPQCKTPIFLDEADAEQSHGSSRSVSTTPAPLRR